jgi:hypothetical protein
LLPAVSPKPRMAAVEGADVDPGAGLQHAGQVGGRCVANVVAGDDADVGRHVHLRLAETGSGDDDGIEIVGSSSVRRCQKCNGKRRGQRRETLIHLFLPFRQASPHTGMTEQGSIGRMNAGRRPAPHPRGTSAGCLRPVSGLASLDAPPSQVETQWHRGAPALAYRCGGSSGVVPKDAPLSRLTAVGESVRSTCYGAHSTSLLAAMHHKLPAGVSTNHFQNKGLVLDHALI